jgi:hypothetical protein
MLALVTVHTADGYVSLTLCGLTFGGFTEAVLTRHHLHSRVRAPTSQQEAQKTCAIERLFSMTMFSSKPKFNLAEFLAVPAPVGARGRIARNRGMQFQTRPASDDATKPTPVEKPGTTDAQK